MVASWVPDAGDVIWVDFDPTVGHEQAGKRPALVLSPSSYNAKTDLLLACAMTLEVKGYPFEVAVPRCRRGACRPGQVHRLEI